MRIEYIIYIFEVVLMVFLLIRFIPKYKIHKAHVAYMFTVAITWLTSLIVSEYRLIEYPIRFFPYANKSNFLFEYFLYPSVCSIFVVNYPEKKSKTAKFVYYFWYCTTLTTIEAIQERYTDILEYINWNWAITWVTFFITFYMSRKYNQWFFKRIEINSK